jgi:hypothetical protein
MNIRIRSAMPVRMLDLPSAMARAGDEVRGILLAEYIQCFFEATLLDQAVASQIPT